MVLYVILRSETTEKSISFTFPGSFAFAQDDERDAKWISQSQVPSKWQ